MKLLVIMMLLLGGCSALLPAKFKREKATMQQQTDSIHAVKKV